MTKYFKVAVNTPFNNSVLTYKSDFELKRGDLVSVPLGKRKEKGCVLEEEKSTDFNQEKIKEIFSKENSSVTTNYLSLINWVADYYHFPVGQHLFDVLPKELKRPREVLPVYGEGNELPYLLTEEQKKAAAMVESSLGSFKRFLLHGVTGAGKTSVYIKVIKEVLKKGQSVLLMVPEINLTPQLLSVMTTFLEGEILSYHSSMNNSEKQRVWKRVSNSKEPFILIGVRSSIFLSYKDLGLIIVDEEHDNSFKQEDRCPYHARDVATKIASLQSIPILLGSATPTVESFVKIKSEGGYLQLKNRPKELPMPDIELIDARGDEFNEENWPFTEQSLKEIEKRLSLGEQVLIFVNRLGFATYVQCRSCGHDFNCLNCSSSLKYFKRTQTLECQFCEFKVPYPESCPSCGNLKLLQKGFGTERLHDVLCNKFKKAKIGRFDRDIIKTFTALKETLESFHNRDLDILVGTQMLSKGHDFKGVNLAILMGVDSQLNFPDFRSNEKAFQLVMQTAGRPGRSEMPGKVLIETLSPENKIFELIRNYSYDEFYEEEVTIREALNLPPYGKLAVIYLSSRFQDTLIENVEVAAKLINSIRKKHFDSVEVLGPRPAIIEKRANKFTWTILLKSVEISDLHNLLKTFRENIKTHHSISIKYDIDPQSLS